jgi:hypothetical protein
MNRLAAILPATNVLVNVDATSKKRAFEQAGLLFENQHAIARASSPTTCSRASAWAPPAWAMRGHPARAHQGPEEPAGRRAARAAAHPLRRAGRRAGQPADLPAGARGGHAAAPGDPLRDRRDAVRPRPARAPEDRARRRRRAQADLRLGAAEVGGLSPAWT